MHLLPLVPLLLLPLLAAGSSPLGPLHIDPSTGHFICSDSNRTVILHGVNAVYKKFPFAPVTSHFDPLRSLSADDAKTLHSLGFNVVRLGVMWPGVEPSRGKYNTTYLSTMRNITELLAEEGIWTMLDFHQDLLHPSLCGEGLPDFALRVTARNCSGNLLEKLAKLIGACKSFADYDFPTDPSTGYPTEAACLNHTFPLYYPSPDVSSAFQSLYSDADLQEALAQYWQVVVKHFTDAPWAALVDLFNEPWAGMVWDDLQLMEPGHTDHRYLQPLYNLLYKSIRQVNPDIIIGFEGTQVPDSLPILNGLVFPNGFSAPPSGNVSDANQALSYHVYCCQAGANACDGSGNPTDYALCDKFNGAKSSVRISDSKRLVNGGSILSEFGACGPTADCVAEIDRVASVADANLQSWAYWQYKYFEDVTTTGNGAEGLFNSDGSLQAVKAKALARTYPRATQGRPLSFTFDSSTGAFNFTYQVDPAVRAPTEVFLHAAYYYPHGVSFSPSDAVLTHNLLTIPVRNSTMTQTVTITAKSS